MSVSDLIYLDHAAATPCDERVVQAMQPYLVKDFFNPSSPYAPAVSVRQVYEDAKHRLAVAIGGRQAEVIMTAGATESINLAMTAGLGGHVVSSHIEHHAVLYAAERYDNTLVSVNEYGQVDPSDIANAIKPTTQMVTIALANNEIGTIQSLRSIGEVVKIERQRRVEAGDERPIWLHTDASQGVGQIDVNTARLGVDMMTLNAGKCYGPKQIGLLWRRAGVQLEPLLFGGGQEMNMRSGTENVAGTIGFATALELAEKHRKTEPVRLSGMRDYLQSKISNAFETVTVSGHSKKRLPGSLHISFVGLDAERLVFRLERRGVLVATGSACAANSQTRSHVLMAIGMTDQEADGSLRLTLGKLNDQRQIERAAEIIIEEVAAEKVRVGK